MIYDFRELSRDPTLRYDMISNVRPIYYDTPYTTNHYKDDISLDTSYVGSEIDFKIRSGDISEPAYRLPFSVFKSREVWPTTLSDGHFHGDHVFAERVFIQFKDIYYPYAIRVREPSRTYRVLNIHYIERIHAKMAYGWEPPTIRSIVDDAAKNIEQLYMTKCLSTYPIAWTSQIRKIAVTCPYVYEYNTERDAKIVINNIIGVENLIEIFPSMRDHLSVRHMYDPLTFRNIIDYYGSTHPTIPGESHPLTIPRSQYVFTIENPHVRACVPPLRDIVADEVYCTCTFFERHHVSTEAHMYFDRYVHFVQESYFQDDMDNMVVAAKIAIDELCLYFYNTPIIDVFWKTLDVKVQKTSNEEASIVIYVRSTTDDKNMALACLYIDFTLSALTCYSLCVDCLRVPMVL